MSYSSSVISVVDYLNEFVIQMLFAWAGKPLLPNMTKHREMHRSGSCAVTLYKTFAEGIFENLLLSGSLHDEVASAWHAEENISPCGPIQEGVIPQCVKSE